VVTGISIQDAFFCWIGASQDGCFHQAILKAVECQLFPLCPLVSWLSSCATLAKLGMYVHSILPRTGRHVTYGGPMGQHNFWQPASSEVRWLHQPDWSCVTGTLCPAVRKSTRKAYASNLWPRVVRRPLADGWRKLRSLVKLRWHYQDRWAVSSSKDNLKFVSQGVGR